MRSLIIRADADAKMGMGHVMRCLALGQVWRDYVGPVIFISRCESSWLLNQLDNEKFSVVKLNRVHPAPSDLATLLQLTNANRENAPWVIVDGYQFDAEYLARMKQSKFCKIMVIDDYNHLNYYSVDILLNQNLNATQFTYNCSRRTIKLLGVKYVLLRREFLQARKKKRLLCNQARRILITMGGGDSGKMLLKVLESLNRLKYLEIEVRAVVSPLTDNLSKMERCLQHATYSGRLVAGYNMPRQINWADLGVSAGGSTCWELACLGLPFLTVVLSENQEGIVRELDRRHVAINCGWADKLSKAHLVERIKALSIDLKIRNNMSCLGQQFVDGLGSKRVLKIMRRLL